MKTDAVPVSAAANGTQGPTRSPCAPGAANSGDANELLVDELFHGKAAHLAART